MTSEAVRHWPTHIATFRKATGPLKVAIRLPQRPKAITLQPENKPLETTWADGLATVTLPKLELYSILVVEE